LAVLVLGVPFESWAVAVAVSFWLFFLRSSFSLLFGSLTVTDRVVPGGIEKLVLPPSRLRVPVHAPTVPAGQPTFTFTPPFFETRALPAAIVTPANGGYKTRTEAAAVADLPVESVTVTVPTWSPRVENVRWSEAPGPPPPSSKVHE
jgi:hypothetical protein